MVRKHSRFCGGLPKNARGAIVPLRTVLCCRVIVFPIAAKSINGPMQLIFFPVDILLGARALHTEIRSFAISRRTMAPPEYPPIVTLRRSANRPKWPIRVSGPKRSHQSQKTTRVGLLFRDATNLACCPIRQGGRWAIHLKSRSIRLTVPSAALPHRWGALRLLIPGSRAMPWPSVPLDAPCQRCGAKLGGPQKPGPRAPQYRCFFHTQNIIRTHNGNSPITSENTILRAVERNQNQVHKMAQSTTRAGGPASESREQNGLAYP